MGGLTATNVAAAAVWLALTLAGLARAAGGAIPEPIFVICVAVAAPIALAAAGHTIAAYWRGPTIHSFRRDESIVLSSDEAAFVRLSSQLRGTMGGAGFLYPRRIFLAAVAWMLAAAEGVSLLSRDAGVATLVLVAASVASASVAFFFPARPYYYLEAAGGSALLSPPSVAYRLKRRAIIANELAHGQPVDVTTPPPTPLPNPALTPSRPLPPDAS